MGIDLVKRGRFAKRNKRTTKSKNLYTHLLIKLFTFLARRSETGFSKTVLRRLKASRTSRPPVSMSRIIRNVKDSKKIAVVVGTVTDDQRVLDMPKVDIAAMRFTESARARITAAGGSCITLDQLVMKCPSGTGTLMLRGPWEREARRHFGKARGAGGHAKPYTRSRKGECKTGLR